MTDRVGVKVIKRTTDGVVTNKPCYLKAICTMHSTGASGTIKFYDLAGAPEEGDVEKCSIDVVAVGVYPFYVPEPGALFEKGLYVDLPANTSVNFFFVDV
jgi:hypothetical protein